MPSTFFLISLLYCSRAAPAGRVHFFHISKRHAYVRSMANNRLNDDASCNSPTLHQLNTRISHHNAKNHHSRRTASCKYHAIRSTSPFIRLRQLQTSGVTRTISSHHIDPTTTFQFYLAIETGNERICHPSARTYPTASAADTLRLLPRNVSRWTASKVTLHARPEKATAGVSTIASKVAS